MWGAVVKRLGVGTARRFSGTTRESLVTDLRAALEPARIARAQDVSTRTRKPVESVAAAADRLEEFALLTRGRT
jgi:UDP:flavonoid glycosyltransferase YjiC (YdhE family)